MRFPAVKSTHKLLIVLLLSVMALVLGLVILLSYKAQIKESADSGGIVLSQCISCHSNYDTFKIPGLIFRHGVHLEKGIRCAACHTQSPYRQDKTARVSMETCYACHGLRHSGKGLIARENCELCHTPGFNLVPPTHTPPWVASYHKNDAGQNPSSCRMCHKTILCESCHQTKGVIPLAHRSVEKWRKTHGQESRAQGGCESCHADTYCLDCHRTPIPHSVVYLGKHQKESKRQGVNCQICHRQEEYCGDCHHGGLEEMKLVKGNCIRCHAEVGKDFLEIRVESLAIHKAHFEMPQTEPFECWVCHRRGIRQSRAEWSTFNLCYNCHGVYRRGKLIAKWPGSQLCYRCHQPK